MSVPTLLSPREILALDPDAADRLLEELERTVPVRPPLVVLDGAEEALVFGDTHGDWPSTLELVRLWGGFPTGTPLVGLGDYVDRCPDDCPDGSVANALYLLSLAAHHPDRVFLLQGNHETDRRIPVLPRTLPEEVDDLWGPEADRYHRLAALLERGPLAMATPSGVYLAHAGFPRDRLEEPWTRAFDRPDDDRLAEIVWAECDASRNRRGGAPPWRAEDLDRFCRSTGLRAMLRGHDPDVAGRPLYEGRCLTLHTTRIYERFGGVLAATLPLRSAVTSVRSLGIHHLPSEGRSYPGAGR